MKGVTARQVKDVGITLILNNTYHLGLRPGTEILDLVGGKFGSTLHEIQELRLLQARTNSKDGMGIF